MLRERGDPFDMILVDRDLSAAHAVGTHGVPDHLFIDSSGAIRYHGSGEILADANDREYFSLLLTQMLAGK